MDGTKIVVRSVVTAVLGVLLLSDTSTAHLGSLSGSVAAGPVPPWLTVATGGVIVGASFLFTSLMTDHAAIRSVNGWGFRVGTPARAGTAARRLIRGTSVGLLLLVVATGLVGPRTPVANFAILAVWVGWWAGYTMTVYLVGDTWPLLNPWRALASPWSRDRYRPYPERLGGWPAVAGLLAVVWLEVVSPVATEPRYLALLIVGYSSVTLAGAVVYGPDVWFGRVDPIARVFRCYGRMAPLQRTDTGFEFKLPSTALAGRDAADHADDTAFVVALLWVTTYDGLVSTPLWATATRPLVGAGLPPLVLYLAAIVAGFGLFHWAYRRAARAARRTARTYVTAGFIERWFAPALLPIAAGYHLAHFGGYFLALSPALWAVGTHPFAPPAEILVIVLPDWFGSVSLAFVLLGHLLAVWIAHALAFELFPGRLAPIRSQYPFVAVMVLYTVTSMWIVSQPTLPPPYV